ncbi:lasso peptide biosynthesis B2 protein [Risungbinella massiliensis]|uniref:lasso peptide biosynthesis B2 protein n=1 Tax=Risungbinella massiliensis TaxID=1329796 RepID=UPI0005CB8FCF
MGRVVSFILSYWYLFFYYRRLRKKGLQDAIKNIEDETVTRNKRLNEGCIISGFQLACKLHFLNIECLERSLALYKLLRFNNMQSRLCIGIKKKPFLSHAWVETPIRELDESKYRDKFQVFLQYQREDKSNASSFLLNKGRV